ncbi:MAG: helix-turn-helix transcriptional regulator [Mycoplasmataceae bacterium]|jgi:transcriptional regulator with XRE-family HTH domain|nr:helix-turn-helix transcriptional regulator [Mycoplasmataceae bacterium]
MASNLCKILKKIRIDNDDILYTMARKLGISSSYLSAIENGKREIPSDFIAKLTNVYHLDEKTINQIEEIASENYRNVKINISNSDMFKKNIAINFARKFDDLDEETIKKMIELIKGGKK